MIDLGVELNSQKNNVDLKQYLFTSHSLKKHEDLDALPKY